MWIRRYGLEDTYYSHIHVEHRHGNESRLGRELGHEHNNQMDVNELFVVQRLAHKHPHKQQAQV